MTQLSLAEFTNRYLSGGRVRVTEVDGSRDDDGFSPYIIVRHGPHVMIINPLAFDDHLCLDVHSFTSGEHATAGVLGMTDGRQACFPATGTTSHGWNSSSLVAVLLGEQKETTA